MIHPLFSGRLVLLRVIWRRYPPHPLYRRSRILFEGVTGHRIAEQYDKLADHLRAQQPGAD